MAAVLFGASTPAVKVLSAGIGANAGAALLYGGSGIGLLLLLLLKRLRGKVVAPIPSGARLRFVGAIAWDSSVASGNSFFAVVRDDDDMVWLPR